MYWLVKLDDIRALLEVPSLMFTIAAVIGLVITLCTICVVAEGEMKKMHWWYIVRTTFVMWVLVFFTAVPKAFLPSTRQACAIIVTPMIVNSMAESDELKVADTVDNEPSSDNK
jgi:hypothetical protein